MSKKGIELKVNVSGKGAKSAQPAASNLGIRLPVQDFKKIQVKCLADGSLYEDPYFPADDSTLFSSQQLPFKPKWLRPGDIVSKPELYTGGASRFDVSQGMLGDCWLVAAIACLTREERLLTNVIPDQSFQRRYCGAFHFHFWHFGEWVDIVIDDRLPTHNGKLIFIHSIDDNEFWSALLEKAYAKLYGSYEALKGGKTSEALVDFTGGLVESFDLTKKEEAENALSQMIKAGKKSSFMSCSIRATGEGQIEQKLDSGLVKGHAYSITGVYPVTAKGKKLNLVRVRNPWGAKEWNGDWSDKSDTWKQLSAKQRQELHTTDEDGEFFMTYEDMIKHFTDLEICSISVDSLYEDDGVKNWNILVKNGSWEGVMAGGCRNYPTFTKNPQFVVELNEDDDGDGKCSCLVALMQKNRRKQKTLGVQDLCIGFSLYKAPEDGSGTLTKKYVDYKYSTGTSGSFTNAREVQKRFDVDPGTYIIMPCTFKPDEEGEFLLRIFTEKSTKGAIKESLVDSKKSAKLRAMFARIAGSDGEIDADELQDMLTASLSKDMGTAVFSMDACRAMITMMDRDKNGTLNINEFESLLQNIALWKRMFFKFDRNRSGTLEKQEVHETLTSLGYSLSIDAFSTMFNRFSTRRTFMKLDAFCACLARVKIMTDTFEKLNNFKSDGAIQLTQDEFYKITLDA